MPAKARQDIRQARFAAVNPLPRFPEETMPDDAERKPLRSTHWFAHPDRDGFAHRSWMRNQGLPSHVFDGRPVIGICNTWP